MKTLEHISTKPHLMYVHLCNSEQLMMTFRAQFSQNFASTVQHFHLHYIAELANMTQCREPHLNQTTGQSLISLV